MEDNRQIEIEMACINILRDLDDLIGKIRNPSDRKHIAPFIDEIRGKSATLFYANVGEEFTDNLKASLDRILPPKGGQKDA